MAVYAHRYTSHLEYVFAVRAGSPIPLNVRTGEAERFGVPWPTVRRRRTLAFLGWPGFLAPDRFRLGQVVVALDATALETVAFASVPSSGTPAAGGERFAGFHVARLMLGVANVRRGSSTVATGYVARRQTGPTADRAL